MHKSNIHENTEKISTDALHYYNHSYNSRGCHDEEADLSYQFEKILNVTFQIYDQILSRKKQYFYLGCTSCTTHHEGNTGRHRWMQDGQEDEH